MLASRESGFVTWLGVTGRIANSGVMWTSGIPVRALTFRPYTVLTGTWGFAQAPGVDVRYSQGLMLLAPGVDVR